MKKKLIILSKCAVCNSKKMRFIKEKNSSGLLSSLGINKQLSKIPLLLQGHKMNETVKKFLLLGDKFMPEMHLIGVLLDHSQKIKKDYKNL